ncbi:MAG: orotate phosphoribosyltransferase [Clostridia bacterium]|nr:orotate phosphoribosyltransferase [Clostridia bacterium]
MSNKLVSFLFQTNAFKVCPANQPFWLTSGLISPYFVNTHFLYGNESDSVELLDFITKALETESKTDIPGLVFEKVLDQYERNEVFKTTIDSLKNLIAANIDLKQIDYVSGGERRDWYFSIMIAYLLGLPHITLFKDQSAVVSTCDFEESTEVEKLQGKKVLHVADLLTKASSYVNYWAPAIKKLGSDIYWSAVVVDRLEGGEETLKELRIESLSLVKLDNSLFLKALELGVINKSQLEMLNAFKQDPYTYMRNFLIAHPEFLENALKADPKTAKRAQSCIDQDLYHLKND